MMIDTTHIILLLTIKEVLNEKSIFDDEFSFNYTEELYKRDISQKLNHDIDDMTFVTSTLDSTIIGGWIYFLKLTG